MIPSTNKNNNMIPSTTTKGFVAVAAVKSSSSLNANNTTNSSGRSSEGKEPLIEHDGHGVKKSLTIVTCAIDDDELDYDESDTDAKRQTVTANNNSTSSSSSSSSKSDNNNKPVWTLTKGWSGGNDAYYTTNINGYWLRAHRPLPSFPLITINDFISDDEANHILSVARAKQLQRSETTIGITDRRTSYQANDWPRDVIHTRVLARIEVALGVSSLAFGGTLRYTSGTMIGDNQNNHIYDGEI
jgi:hypothetical protein